MEFGTTSLNGNTIVLQLLSRFSLWMYSGKHFITKTRKIQTDQTKASDIWMTLTKLSEKVGITMANLSYLKTGKISAVRLATMEAICRHLACQPGDLFEYAED